VTTSGAEDGLFRRAARAAAWATAALLAAGCAGPTAPGTAPGTATAPSSPAPGQPGGPDTFLPPPSSDTLERALRTDMCALLDETLLAVLGWQRGPQAQTLTSCGAASADQKRSVSVSVDTAVSDRPAPSEGSRCTRLRIVDTITMIALKVQLRAEPDPCQRAEEFLATAARRFADGAGQVPPPTPWIALDACELLPKVLPASSRILGGPRPTLREVRRLGARGCIASHVDGEVTLSVAPVPGRIADLDGDEVAVAFGPARVRELNGTCLLRLVGQQLGEQQPGEPRRPEVQVVTVEVQAGGDPCAVATALADALAPVLPRS